MASSRYQVEITLLGAKGLKNVNWRHGPLRPYAVVWVDPNNKSSTRADSDGDCFPVWEQTLQIPLPPGTAVGDAALHVDVVHAGSEDGTKALIGSARLRLSYVLEDDDDGYGGGDWRAKKRSLQLKRPSGRPHGKVDVEVAVRETCYRAPPAAYGLPPPAASREYTRPPAYTAPPAYGSAYRNPYAPPQPQYERQDPYYSTAPPAGYPSYSGTSYGSAYGNPYAPPQPQYERRHPYYSTAPPAGYPSYSGTSYGSAYGNPYAPPQPQYERQDPYYSTAPPAGYPSYSGTSYGQQPPSYGQEEKKKSKFGGMGAGMGTALAAGAAAGVAGAFTGFVLAKGVDYVVDKITDVVEKLGEIVTSDDDSEASDDDSEASDYDSEAGAGDTDDQASEDEGDLASEIDLPYGDDGGDDIDN